MMILKIILAAIVSAWGILGFINVVRVNRIVEKYGSKGLFNPLVPMERADKNKITKYLLYQLIGFVALGVLIFLLYSFFAWKK